MNIKAKVYKINGENSVRALATITIEDCFVVSGIRIIQSSKGNLFVSMPNRKTANGEYKDICFPITAEFRNQIIDSIMTAYNDLIEEQEEREAIKQADNYSQDFDDSLPF